MNELWYIPVAGLLGLLSTFITSKGGLYDKRFKSFKKLTKRGWLVATLGLSIIGLSVWQYITTQTANKIKEDEQATERNARDSIISAEINKGIDNNRRKLFSDLSEALAKQNLRLDTVTKNLENLKDSAKTIVINTPKATPILLVQSDGLKLLRGADSITNLDITLVSTEAAANVLRIDYFIQVFLEDGSKLTSKESKVLMTKVLFPKDQPVGRTISLETTKKVSLINIALFGRYSATDNNKLKTIKEVYRFRVSLGQTGFMGVEEKDIFFAEYNLKI